MTIQTKITFSPLDDSPACPEGSGWSIAGHGVLDTPRYSLDDSASLDREFYVLWVREAPDPKWDDFSRVRQALDSASNATEWFRLTKALGLDIDTLPKRFIRDHISSASDQLRDRPVWETTVLDSVWGEENRDLTVWRDP